MELGKVRDEETFWRFHERNCSCVRVDFGLSSVRFSGDSVSAPIVFLFQTFRFFGEDSDTMHCYNYNNYITTLQFSSSSNFHLRF